MLLNFDKLSVQIVEGTMAMNKLMVSVLDTLGVGQVHQSFNSEEGFQVFCKDRPDIILTEWILDPTSGLDLTHKIRTDANSPNKMAPVIMLTGYNSFKRVVQARDAGVTEFLVKPFTVADLAKRIAYVINRPRDFVNANPKFCGPDRRRIISEAYLGPFRRRDDEIDLKEEA